MSSVISMSWDEGGGLVNRIRLEATGRSGGDVDAALTRGIEFIEQSWGGTWYEDDDYPRMIQTAAKGYWGYVWVKRVVTA